MSAPRDYLRGKRSQAAVARELGISVRQLQRIEDEALAWLQLGICRSIRREIGDLGPTQIPCRFPRSRPETKTNGSRAAQHTASGFSPLPDERHASQISERKHMKATTQQFISKLEQLARAHPEWPSTFTAARAAVDADYATAEGQIFSYELQPCSADAISTYAFYIQRFAVGTYAEDLARLHARSIRTHPGVAALARSVDALADVEQAAQVNMPPPAPTETWAEVGVRVAKRARRAYEVKIATQLAAVDGHELRDAAGALLNADEQATKLDALKAAHDQHVAAEQARIEVERIAREKAEQAERDQRELADELRTELATLGAHASDTERARITACVTLQHRFRRTKVSDVRLGREVYSVASFVGVKTFSLEQAERFSRALDHAEANAAS